MKKEGKTQAIKLRKVGNSYAQIATKLRISQSTAYVWAKNVTISEQAQQKIQLRVERGRVVGQNKKHDTHKLIESEIQLKIADELTGLAFSSISAKILCAFLYWCEGGKIDRQVRFTNSDPNLVATFLKLFRISFPIDEKKFSVCLHLHKYHDSKTELDFWAEITGIPLSRFTKVYQKYNTGLRKKDGYRGCVSIRYHDVKVWHEIREVYTQASQKI